MAGLWPATCNYSRGGVDHARAAGSADDAPAYADGSAILDEDLRYGHDSHSKACAWTPGSDYATEPADER